MESSTQSFIQLILKETNSVAKYPSLIHPGCGNTLLIQRHEHIHTWKNYTYRLLTTHVVMCCSQEGLCIIFMTLLRQRTELAVHFIIWNSEFLFSWALVGASMKQPKSRADTGCSSPVNLPEDHIFLWVNIHYVLNPITHLRTISSAIYDDGSDHCGPPLGWAVPAVMRNAGSGTEKYLGFVQQTPKYALCNWVLHFARSSVI